MKERGLTPKQATFVDEYLKDLNATQAAIRAGYSKKTAEWIGPQLLTKNHVAEAVASRMRAREKRTEITQDRVLQEYARLAFIDPAKLFDESGRPLPIQQMDEDTRRAIIGVDVATVGNDQMGIGEVLKLRLADKRAALDSVARHLGMFNDKLDLNVTGPLAERLARARARNG